MIILITGSSSGIGKDIAKYIYNNPMTFEEYYVRFLDK